MTPQENVLKIYSSAAVQENPNVKNPCYRYSIYAITPVPPELIRTTHHNYTEKATFRVLIAYGISIESAWENAWEAILKEMQEKLDGTNDS